jgi:hypothetical protein
VKSESLTGERIAELSLKLAMLSSQRSIGQADLQYRQLEESLRWHRWSCQPIQVGRRIVHASLSRRLPNCLALIREQKVMLQLAADEGSDDALVLDALVALATAVAQFELGLNPTPRQRLAFAACEVPAIRARFAQLVRAGDVESAHNGLTLLRTARRRVEAYQTFALIAGWEGALFIAMALNGAIDQGELVGYLVGSVVFSAYLTSGLFAELRADDRAVRELNAQLRPRASGHKHTSN